MWHEPGRQPRRPAAVTGEPARGGVGLGRVSRQVPRGHAARSTARADHAAWLALAAGLGFS